MRLTTLCYITHEDRVLMLLRNCKPNDENAGKWIGIGGHMMEDESPEECIRREAMEETGLVLENLRLRGILTFILPDWGNELTFLYTASSSSACVTSCPEGELAWIPWDQLPSLSLWEGDRAFLFRLRDTQDVFSMKLIYASGGSLVHIEEN